jgi:integrase
MIEVQAIKDADTIKLISHLLNIRFSQQMSDIWNIGINLALRISDLLSIKFTDIEDGRIRIKETKTGKVASIALNAKSQQIINDISERHPNHTYLFQSYRNQQSISRLARPLSRRAVSKAFSSVGQELNVQLGTHSMRKTRGYHLYQATKDIARVMKMLRHSSEGITLRYIGITQQEVDDDYRELVL